MVAAIEKAVQAGASKLKDRRIGQGNLFDAFDDSVSEASGGAKVILPDVPEYGEKEMAAYEKEVLGYYLTSHPLEPVRPLLELLCSHTSRRFRAEKPRDEVLLGGILSSIKMGHLRNPKEGAPSKFANFDLEDLDGMVRCILWPNDFERVGHHVVPDATVLVRGVIDRRSAEGDEEANLIVNELIPISEAESRFTSGIRIHIDEAKHQVELLPKLREILRGYPGTREVSMAVKVDSGDVVHMKSNALRVEIVPELRVRLDDLLGPNSHRLLTARPTLKTASQNRNQRRP